MSDSKNHTIGAGHLGHPRRQPVIVAVADLGGRHRIVLVDDGHRTEGQQGIQGAARVEIAAALFGIAQGQKNLRYGNFPSLQELLVGMCKANLTNRRSRLTLLKF